MKVWSFRIKRVFAVNSVGLIGFERRFKGNFIGSLKRVISTRFIFHRIPLSTFRALLLILSARCFHWHGIKHGTVPAKQTLFLTGFRSYVLLISLFIELFPDNTVRWTNANCEATGKACFTRFFNFSSVHDQIKLHKRKLRYRESRNS